jgi:DNA-binding LacI/PurR family transcriptional regulator
MPDKLTMQGIARLASISKVTVSRVLNHNPSVNYSLLRERVYLVVGASSGALRSLSIGL